MRVSPAPGHTHRVWGAGRFTRTGKDRVRLQAYQAPVTVDGVVIQPGELFCCDEDCVVAVPDVMRGHTMPTFSSTSWLLSTGCACMVQVFLARKRRNRSQATATL